MVMNVREKLALREEFIKALRANEAAFGLELGPGAAERLADHYELVTEHNPLLHLVGPSSPEEFAVRHVLESLTMLEFVRKGATFADVGTGAGFPAIPCLIVREDLKGVLIESKEKKTAFLTEAVHHLGLEERAEVVNKQFSEFADPRASVICCRAIDKFADVLPKLIKWAGNRKLLFFGGPKLKEGLTRSGRPYTQKLMPLSEQRYLFIIE